MKQLFPKLIYVVREEDGADTFLATHEIIDTIDDASVVAIYEYKSSAKLKMTKELVSL